MYQMNLMYLIKRIDQQHLRTGRLRDDEWERLPEAASKLSEAPMFIDETAGLNPAELRARLQAYPSGDARLPLQGALALRGGARPNPLSFTVCRLRKVAGRVLEVDGLDLVDGTPVLDVKPYIAFYDAEPNASLPKWARG